VVAILGFALLVGADAKAVSWMLLVASGVTGLAAWHVAERVGIATPSGNSVDRPAHEDAPPYASLIDALPDPVLVIAAHEPDDLTGRRFVLVNAAARETLRIQYDAGLLVTVIRDPDVLEAVDEALFGQTEAEAVYEMGGAQERVMRAIAKPLGEAPDGAPLALLVLRDETDIRRAERMRADFLANASHELRTPLASLSGFIETLRGHAKDDPGAREKFLSIMQAQAERMSRLIDDLLSLSRIELNEHIAPHGEVDLVMAVMDVLDSLGPLARDRGVRLDAEGLPGRGEVMIAGDRDRQVHAQGGGGAHFATQQRIGLRRGDAGRPARGALLTADARSRRGHLRGAARQRRGRGPGPRTPAAPDRAVLSGRGAEERRALGHRPRARHRQARRQPASRRTDG